MKTWMQTHWEDLLLVNYDVEREWVEKFVPAGCELDLYDGRALVSVVMFRFRKTRLAGIPMPLYRDFPEINLRIYVKRWVAGEWRRGVVFIKEIIPGRFPALIARRVFKENFHVMPVSHSRNDEGIEYMWGDWNVAGGKFASGLKDWEKGSEEEFVSDHFWAYKEMSVAQTCEFEVWHREWKMRELADVNAVIDIESLYGAGWAGAMNPKPSTVFYLDGSAVGVTLPHKLRPEE